MHQLCRILKLCQKLYNQIEAEKAETELSSWANAQFWVNGNTALHCLRYVFIIYNLQCYIGGLIEQTPCLPTTQSTKKCYLIHSCRRLILKSLNLSNCLDISWTQTLFSFFALRLNWNNPSLQQSKRTKKCIFTKVCIHSDVSLQDCGVFLKRQNKSAKDKKP